MSGRLISVEGGEGAGKSSVMAAIRAAIDKGGAVASASTSAAGVAVVTTAGTTSTAATKP